MGNCATIYQSKEPAKKVEYSITQGKCNVQMESSIKETGVNGHLHKAGIGSVPPRDSGNPEEMFFDSHALLDSDCEDFVSVGGDFTPSSSHGGGTTPIHNSFREPPPPGKESESSSTSSSSPAANPKKQLIELLCESFRSDDDHDHHQPSSTPPHDDGNHNQLNKQEKVETKPLTFYCSSKHAANGSSRPCNELLLPIGSPICLSQPTPNAISNPDDNERDQKATPSTHGCLPNLLRNLSFSERKKRRLSHGYGGGDRR